MEFMEQFIVTMIMITLNTGKLQGSARTTNDFLGVWSLSDTFPIMCMVEALKKTFSFPELSLLYHDLGPPNCSKWSQSAHYDKPHSVCSATGVEWTSKFQLITFWSHFCQSRVLFGLIFKSFQISRIVRMTLSSKYKWNICWKTLHWAWQSICEPCDDQY